MSTNYLRDVFFSGDTIVTTVTTEPATVSRWISETISTYQQYESVVVGLDVEWNPFVKSGEPQKPAATVQICENCRCLIYQILRSEYIPQSLADFLSDHKFVFVGVGVEKDLKKLAYDYYGIGSNARAVDLGMLAADTYNEPDLKQAAMVRLASVVLGVEMKKPPWVKRSRWDDLYLTDEQVEYACIDAFVSFKIGWVLNANW